MLKANEAFFPLRLVLLRYRKPGRMKLNRDSTKAPRKPKMIVISFMTNESRIRLVKAP